MDVVAGLLVPESGHVAVDGVPIDPSNLRAWQSVLAYVPQDAFLLDASIAENIAIGVGVDHIDWARLRDAGSRAQLEDWVSSLPRGYDEPIGEGGVRASGGQRQRIALARGLYRSASVIILDETTSSLDASAEQDVMQALVALRERCTILVVSHRHRTLEYCDRVIDLTARQPRATT
jgi:ATP-binding cassette subfamily B protein